MCGICGYISKKSIDEKTLGKMRDTITYRGPDDCGLWQGKSDKFYIGLAHRRLSIIDLSYQGHQPMVSENGRYSLVYNGEIYNYTELKEDLKKSGYIFRSNCDTEVVLKAFECWGPDSFRLFNGMFAIAVWDNVTKKLLLARDKIGKKPLYYYFNSRSGDFVFASELKPIMSFPYFVKNIRQASLGDFFCNKCIAAPNTIYEDTYKLVPGTYIEYDLNVINQSIYWDITEKKQLGLNCIISNYDTALSELERIIRDSVNRRMIADVKVGTFLSGGIDSSLITLLAAQEISDKVNSFSIGFYDKEKDEAPFAKAIADYIGTNHTELYVSNEELLKMVDMIPEAYDEPFSDASQIPSLAVSNMASRDVKVVLTGDGGDELFCGYTMYDWVFWAQRFDRLGAVLHLIPGLSESKLIPFEVKAFINNRRQDRKTQLFTDVRYDISNNILLDDLSKDKIKYSQESVLEYKNWQERRMLLDMMTYIPDEILCKMDRASMHSSIEARCPLLDYRVIELSFKIPQNYKYKCFDKKHILKDISYKYIPKSLLNRPKKGFSPPIREWLRKDLKENLKRFADHDVISKQGIFDNIEIDKLISCQAKKDSVTFTSVLWSFYVFQSWYDKYIDELL